MTDTEERLREHGIMAGWLIEKDAEIARLRKVIDEVDTCLAYLGHSPTMKARRMLRAALPPAERPDVEKTGEGQ